MSASEKETIEAIFKEIKAWLEPEFEKVANRIDANNRSLSGRIEKLERSEPTNEANFAKCAVDFERRASEILQRVTENLASRGAAADAAPSILKSHVAEWALEFERRAVDLVQRSVDKIPPAQDGMSPDDLQIELKERALTIKFTKGDRIISRNVWLPIPLYRGIFSLGKDYDQGDLVTHSGSMWHAKQFTRKPPPCADWQLCVKRGTDGRDARDVVG